MRAGVCVCACGASSSLRAEESGLCPVCARPQSLPAPQPSLARCLRMCAPDAPYTLNQINKQAVTLAAFASRGPPQDNRAALRLRDLCARVRQTGGQMRVRVALDARNIRSGGGAPAGRLRDAHKGGCTQGQRQRVPSRRARPPRGAKTTSPCRRATGDRHATGQAPRSGPKARPACRLARRGATPGACRARTAAHTQATQPPGDHSPSPKQAHVLNIRPGAWRWGAVCRMYCARTPPRVAVLSKLLSRRATKEAASCIGYQPGTRAPQPAPQHCEASPCCKQSHAGTHRACKGAVQPCAKACVKPC